MAHDFVLKAKKKYKSKAHIAWPVAILSSLLMLGCVGMNFLVQGLSLAIIPFLLIPFFFGGLLTNYQTEPNEMLKVGDYFKNSFVYFRPPFFGSFRLIVSILKTLLVYLGVAFVISMIATLIYGKIDPSGYESMMQTMYNIMLDESATEAELITLLSEKEGSYATFMMATILPSTLIAVIYFIYRISYEAVSVYVRCALFRMNPSLIKTSVANTLRSKRKEIKSEFFILNWPLFVLLILGMTCGSLISIFVLYLDTFTSITVATLFGLFFMMFYLPFYYQNMETIFEWNKIDFLGGVKNFVASVLKNLQATAGMSEEEKDTIEKMFNQLHEENKEDEEDK